MKAPAVVALVLAAILASCSASTTGTVPAPQSSASVSVVTAAPSPASAHTPHWLTIKYRSDPVDVAKRWFVYLDGGSSSLVDATFYDADNRYMIISLNGTAYHYCGMADGAWSEFTAASSLGSFYNDRIKGRFDCRTGFVPEY
jgi:hypothetical protein